MTVETKERNERKERREPKKTMKHAKSNELKKVFICSPFEFQGETEEELYNSFKEIIEVAQRACRFAVKKGCIPYAPQLYFTQFLLDDDQDDDLDHPGKEVVFGLSWLARCDELWVFGEEVTERMALEISMAEEWDIPIRWFGHKESAEDRRKIVITVRFDEYDEDDEDDDDGDPDEFDEFKELDILEALKDFDDDSYDPDDPGDDDICSDCEFRDSCPSMN